MASARGKLSRSAASTSGCCANTTSGSPVLRKLATQRAMLAVFCRPHACSTSCTRARRPAPALPRACARVAGLLRGVHAQGLAGFLLDARRRPRDLRARASAWRATRSGSCARTASFRGGSSRWSAGAAPARRCARRRSASRRRRPWGRSSATRTARSHRTRCRARRENASCPAMSTGCAPYGRDDRHSRSVGTPSAIAIAAWVRGASRLLR